MALGRRLLWKACGLAALVMIGIPSSGILDDSGESDWQRLGVDGFAWTLPAGWAVDDPFTMHTPYGNHYWFNDLPEHDTRVALIHSRGRGTNLLVMFGDRATLCTPTRTGFTTYDTHPLVTVLGEDDVVTADGAPVHWKAIRMEPGLIAGKDVAYFLAVATRGDDALVISGGGRFEDFDLDASIELVTSLRLR